AQAKFRANSRPPHLTKRVTAGVNRSTRSGGSGRLPTLRLTPDEALRYLASGWVPEDYASRLSRGISRPLGIIRGGQPEEPALSRRWLSSHKASSGAAQTSRRVSS